MPASADELYYRDQPLSQWLTAAPDGENVWQGIGQALKATVSHLAREAQEGNGEQRLRAVRALSSLGEQMQWVLPALQGALKEVALEDRDPAVREEAVGALSQHIGPHAGQKLSALADALKDELPAVRLGATRALAELGARGYPAVPGLIHVSQWDHDGAVRTHAAVAIWKIDRRDRIAVPVLMRSLREPDEVLRWVAADCLGDIGAEALDAVPDLKMALADTYRTPLVRQAIKLALERIEQAAQAVSA
ncbi:MAG: HEAT repeat domain-containing protein [Gemmataceae bacterium]